MEHFNQLTPAEHERLSILFEECSEVIQAIGKIMRHGYDSNDNGNRKHTNRQYLEKELGDLMHALNRLYLEKDVSVIAICEAEEQKRVRIVPYLHHQTRESDHG